MKRALSLILVLLLALALIAGCSDSGSSSGSSGSGNPDLTPRPNNSGNTGSTGDAGDTGDTGDAGDAGDAGDTGSLINLPIVTDKVEFTIWANDQTVSGGYGIQDLNETETFQEIERRTNVHINWITPPRTDVQTSLGLLLSGGDMPDSLMLYYSQLPGGLDQQMDDENIIDITDLVVEYCPNYYAQISEGDMWLGARTDTHRMPGFYGIKRTVQPAWTGPIARKDIMNNLGIDTPYTLDDYHDMYVAFRDGGVEVPTTITNTGLQGEFLAAFDLNANWFQKDGTVYYSPMQDSFLDYLTVMKQWYDEGLIDPDFYAASGFDAKNYDTAYTLTGRIAQWSSTYQTIHSNMATQAADGDTTYELVAIPYPTKNVGDTRHLGDTPQDRWQGNIGAITPECEDKVTLAKWYDYLFSDEGWVLSSYGAGSAYFIDEDGHPRGNEIITNNPDGLSPYQAMCKYSMSPDIPTLYDWERELLVTMNDNALGAFDIWMANDDNAYALPQMLFPTTEESTRFSAIMTDVETYLSEIVVKFISGVEPLENFEVYRQNITNLGIDDAIAIKQASYDRYMAR